MRIKRSVVPAFVVGAFHTAGRSCARFISAAHSILPWNTDPEGATGGRINPEPAPSDTTPHPN